MSNILVTKKGKKADLAGETIYLFEKATVQLVATAVAGNGDTLNVDLVWSTNADHFANVDQTGMVTAVAKGSAEIMVENEATGTASTVTVMVQKAVGSVVVSTDDGLSIEPGETIMVSAQAYDGKEGAGAEVEDVTYTWHNGGKDAIATVKADKDDSSMATVTAKAAGSVEIYAMVGNVPSKKLKVTVIGIVEPSRRIVVDTGNAPFKRYYYAEASDVDATIEGVVITADAEAEDDIMVDIDLPAILAKTDDVDRYKLVMIPFVATARTT